MLGPDEREKLMKHFFEKLNNEAMDGPLNKKSFKIRADATKEEMIQKISDVMNIPPEMINLDFLKTQVETRERWLAIQEIIKPFKTFLENQPKIKPDKFEELTDIGNFILASKLPIHLQVPKAIQKYPDFTIALEGEMIGVEHTRLINGEMKAVTATAQRFLKEAERIIQTKHGNLSGIVNVFINFEKTVINNRAFSFGGFSIADSEIVRQDLATYIASFLLHTPTSKPDYVQKIDYSPNPGYPLSLSLGEDYFAIDGFKDLIKKRIEAKEKRLTHYQSEANVKRCWLLITTDGVSSHSGFDIKKEIFIYQKESGFELIIFFDAFSGDIYVIYDVLRRP